MTDFKTWERKTLEEFARQAADENKELRDQLRVSKFGLQVNSELKSHWNDALTVLADLPEQKQDSFAMLVLAVSDCFTNKDRAGVFIFHRDSELIMATAGCTELECAGILQASNVVMQEKVYAGAPTKEMMN